MSKNKDRCFYKKCVRYAQDGIKCCRIKSHLEEYYKKNPVKKYCFPSTYCKKPLKGYEKLNYTKEKWIQLLLIQKQVNIPKLLFYKILFESLELFQIINVGDVLKFNRKSYLEHVVVKCENNGRVIKVSHYCRKEINKKDRPTTYKWHDGAGYIYEDYKPIQRNLNDIEVIDHIDLNKK